MTETGPSADDLANLDAQAQIYADETGKPFELAREELANLVSNMHRDPVGTALYFARTELAAVEKVEAVVAAVENHEARLAHLEEIGGGTIVGG